MVWFRAEDNTQSHDENVIIRSGTKFTRDVRARAVLRVQTALAVRVRCARIEQ